ncbi:cystatin-like [Pelobates fuscus]|uniref:cystatin-like n=1 Tax=Pelobates fuscus TaxID=191477 RepID=UPI002FE441F2
MAMIESDDFPAIPGGGENISPDRPDVLKAVDFAMMEFNRKSNDDYLFKVIKVLTAKSQTVQGLLYFLEVEIGRTQCKKDNNSDVIFCDLVKNSDLDQISVWEFQVWDNLWLRKKTLVSYSCTTQ